MDELLDLLVAIRSRFNQSTSRVNKLKIVCTKLKIKYVAILNEFENRFVSHGVKAVNAFCRLLPALYTYFQQ